MLCLHLNGSFRVVSEAGDDLTPTSTKAQGLLALLATAPNGERTRTWLQSRLWSDRGSQQAAASLRQALVHIRRSFGEENGVLQAGRQRVRLDLAHIDVRRAAGLEFLEGIDVRDQEFERWLIDMRVADEDDSGQPMIPGQPAAASHPHDTWTIAIRPARTGNDEIDWMAQIFSDGIARNIRELFSVRIQVGDATPRPNDRLWTITVQMTRVGKGWVGARVSLDHPASGRQAWAGARSVPARGAPPVDSPELMALANQMVEAIGDVMFFEEVPDDPDLLCRRAIRQVFLMRPDSTALAEALFARAHDLRPRGLYLAWRAQIKAIQRVERHLNDEAMLKDAGAEFCARALEAEPNNSMVLATVANTFGHLLRDSERPLYLARRSVMLNPSNPMGWWALSSANVYAGNISASYENAVTARNLALTSPHRFWWDNQLFGAALITGNLDEARRLAEACVAQNADFRPPFRYLIALYANAGRQEEAARVADRLRLIEPDFDVDRLMRDREYPASLIHRTPGLRVERLGDIA